jgi:hypothetical protein
MGLVVGKNEFRDLALYVGVGFTLLAFIVYMSLYHPKVELFSAWTELGAMTALVFGALLKVYWNYRTTVRLWTCLLSLSAVHVGLFAALLRWRLLGDWSFVTTCATLESMILSVIVGLIVGPPAKPSTNS